MQSAVLSTKKRKGSNRIDPIWPQQRRRAHRTPDGAARQPSGSTPELRRIQPACLTRPRNSIDHRGASERDRRCDTCVRQPQARKDRGWRSLVRSRARAGFYSRASPAPPENSSQGAVGGGGRLPAAPAADAYRAHRRQFRERDGRSADPQGLSDRSDDAGRSRSLDTISFCGAVTFTNSTPAATPRATRSP